MSNVETRVTLADFVTKHAIGFTSQWIPARPDNLWEKPREANHYKCRLTCGRRGFTLYFSQGFGIKGAPTVEGVLDCLASDAASYENAGDFEEWASELGFDTDSRKAERIYRVTKRQSEQLKRTIGDEAYEELLWKTEGL